jgi:branched-chain amino acid transport system permease protein
MFLQQIVNGLALGSIYALITIGYSMVYGILGLMNFAHGDVYMVGALVAFSLLVTYGVSLLPAWLASLLVGAALAILVERVAYRRLLGKDRMTSMITAVGVALILRNSEELIWGVRPLPFPPAVRATVVRIGTVQIQVVPFFTLLVSIAVLVSFNMFLEHHKVGKSIRCLAQDIPTARLMGIPASKTISLVYGIGGALGVLGALLYCSSYRVLYISMGFAGTMRAFSAAILGGLGNLNGALLAALILGISESLTAAYISSAYRDAVSFLLLVAILLIRPSGLLGQHVAQKA